MGDWKRLGGALVHRRVQLGYTNRTKFFEVKGVKPSQQRLLIALENCERENFSPSTLAFVEQVYEWSRGSVSAVLAGGEPVIDDEVIPFGDGSLRLERPADITDHEWVQLKAQIADDLEAWRRHRP